MKLFFRFLLIFFGFGFLFLVLFCGIFFIVAVVVVVSTLRFFCLAGILCISLILGNKPRQNNNTYRILNYYYILFFNSFVFCFVLCFFFCLCLLCAVLAKLGFNVDGVLRVSGDGNR